MTEKLKMEISRALCLAKIFNPSELSFEGSVARIRKIILKYFNF